MKIRLLPACFLLLLLCCAVFCCAQADVLTLPAGTLAIEEEGFYQTASLDEVVLPEGIETIGARAFAESGLTKVNLPASLTYIAPDAFDGCEGIVATVVPGSYGEAYAIENKIERQGLGSSVEDFDYSISNGECYIYDYSGTDTIVVIPDEIEGCPVVSIGKTFYENTTVSVVSISKNVERIGDYAFSNCTSLTAVCLPDGLTYIGQGAFSQCSALKSIKIPDSVTYMGKRAFYCCTSLRQVTLSKNVEAIYEETFYRCSSLTEVIFPDGLVNIWNYAFSGCRNLRSISIPDSLTLIYRYAFKSCGLVSVLLPDNNINLGVEAFSNCWALTSVYIPSTSSIGPDCFWGCSDDLTIYCAANSYASTYARRNKIPYVVTEFVSSGNSNTVLATAKISGVIYSANGYPMSGVGVMITSVDDAERVRYAVTNDSGRWEATKLPIGEYIINYSLAGYQFSGDGNNASTSSSLTATGTPTGEQYPSISFTMTLNGQTVTSVPTGTVVDFSVCASGASGIRLIVDGVPYNEYPVENSVASFSRSFSKSGKRKIQIQALNNDEWNAISNAQTLRVTASGTLAKTTIQAIPTQYVNNDLSITWSAVDYAENYAVYLYQNKTLIWPSSTLNANEAVTTDTSMVISGEWLASAGNYAINIVTSGAGYDQSTAVADFVVEPSASLCITSPDDHYTCIVGSQVSIECAYPSTISNIMIAAEDESNTIQLLTPDKKGDILFQPEKTGTYTLTPYYSEASGEFTIETATGCGESISVSVVSPKVHNLCQGVYHQYAYYLDTDEIKPVFTGTVDQNVDISCTVNYFPPDSDIPEPQLGGSFTSITGDGTFTYQSDTLTREGKYIFSFTPFAAGVSGVCAEFPVYVLSDTTDITQYIAAPAKLFSVPQGSVICSLPAGTSVTSMASWGDYVYAEFNEKTGFLKNSFLMDECPLGDAVITNVEYPEHPYLPINETINLQICTNGAADRILVRVNKFTDAGKSTEELYAVPSVEDANTFVLEYPVQSAVYHECEIAAVDLSGNEIPYESLIGFVGYQPINQFAVYSKWLDVAWTTADGHTEYLGWNDPAEYSFTLIGQYTRNDENGSEQHNVYKIENKESRQIIYRSLTKAVGEAAMSYSDTSSVQKRAIIISCYMDKETVTIKNSDGTTSEETVYIHEDDYFKDTAYRNEKMMSELFTSLGISEQYKLRGWTDPQKIQNRVKTVINMADYNDMTYLYLSAHGGVPLENLPRWSLNGEEHLYFYQIGRLLQLEHYTKLYCIIESCYSGDFSPYSTIYPNDAYGNCIEVKIPVFMSTEAGVKGSFYPALGSAVTKLLRDMVVKSSSSVFSLSTLVNQTSGSFQWPLLPTKIVVTDTSCVESTFGLAFFIRD